MEKLSKAWRMEGRRHRFLNSCLLQAYDCVDLQVAWRVQVPTLMILFFIRLLRSVYSVAVMRALYLSWTGNAKIFKKILNLMCVVCDMDWVSLPATIMIQRAMQSNPNGIWWVTSLYSNVCGEVAYDTGWIWYYLPWSFRTQFLALCSIWPNSNGEKIFCSTELMGETSNCLRFWKFPGAHFMKRHYTPRDVDLRDLNVRLNVVESGHCHAHGIQLNCSYHPQVDVRFVRKLQAFVSLEVWPRNMCGILQSNTW